MTSREGTQLGCNQFIIVCKGCGRSFADNDHLSNHQKQTTNTNFKCFSQNQRDEAMSSLALNAVKSTNTLTNPQKYRYGVEQQVNVNTPYYDDMMTNQNMGEYNILDSETTFELEDHQMLKCKDSHETSDKISYSKKRTISDMEKLNYAVGSKNYEGTYPSKGKVTHRGSTYSALPNKYLPTKSITIVQRQTNAEQTSHLTKNTSMMPSSTIDPTGKNTTTIN